MESIKEQMLDFFSQLSKDEAFEAFLDLEDWVFDLGIELQKVLDEDEDYFEAT